MNFSEFNLSKPLQQAIDAMGFEEATPIQTEAIPPGLEQRDVIGCAQTGTGKTAAFMLPALHRALNEPRTSKYYNPKVLVVAPTRELVIQVTREAKKMAQFTKLRITSIYGGSQMKPQISKLRQGTDIVIATPGRLLDHIRRRNIYLRDLQVLVLDEADRMLDMGFMPDIEKIIYETPRQRQTMLFSATMPQSVLNLTQRFQKDPIKIETGSSNPPEAIEQYLYPVPKHLKIDLLAALLEKRDVDSMLVFTATKQEADIVTRKLREQNIQAACIHGDFRQRKRVASLEGFREGRYQVLVATNIAARGLDVEGITHVINYDVPQHPDDYIHRIGRTARGDAEGTAITLVTPDDEPMIHRIEHLLDGKIERKELEGFNYDVPTPTWARPSAETMVRRVTQPRNLAARWRSMGI